MNKKAVLLQSNYLPPIAWIAELKRAECVFIECCDNYAKQTYRTRAKIASGQGVIDLNVPVVRAGEKIQVKDVKISYKDDWQRLHWRALESNYNSSPFFEYYQDDFKPLYETKTEKLFDLNSALLEVVLSELEIERKIIYTTEYLMPNEVEREGIVDLRDAFSPKSELESESRAKKYYQVFNERFGFISGLSIVDLLFNMGPEAILYL